MSSKRELHTLFIKHDTEFKTLSKKGLAQIILKIILFQGESGTKMSQIKSELSNVLGFTISESEINQALNILVRENQLSTKKGKYFIHQSQLEKLKQSAKSNDELHNRIYQKYLSNCETSVEVLKKWFQDTLILFFEEYSLEWFQQVSSNGKFSPKRGYTNIESVVLRSLNEYSDRIKEKDKVWLVEQFIKFIESEEIDENMLFWQYGMSLFSSKIITARNYADKISIDTFKNGTFILDTNILMILDLEGHEFSSSLQTLGKIFKQINVELKYLYTTKEEFRRAMSHRMTDTISVFEKYEREVLETTDCPFVQTALKRGCEDEESLRRMFDPLLEVPEQFCEQGELSIVDNAEILEAVEAGERNEKLMNSIDEIHVRRLKKNKRPNPKKHDAGLINALNHIRKSESAWILTTDGTLKLYAIENCLRDETEIAIGLDVLIGMFAVDGGGTGIDSSNFAPLFKNIIKFSLTPEEDTYDVRDLAFILSTNLKINDLEPARVIEIVKEVRKMRIANEPDEEIALFLRRVIEGDKLTMSRDLYEIRIKEQMERTQKESAIQQRDNVIQQYRKTRTADLEEKYKKELRRNWAMFLGLPIVIFIAYLFVTNYLLSDSSNQSQFLIGIIVELTCGALPLWPLYKPLIKSKRYQLNNIENVVEEEIRNMKKD